MISVNGSTSKLNVVNHFYVYPFSSPFIQTGTELLQLYDIIHLLMEFEVLNMGKKKKSKKKQFWGLPKEVRMEKAKAWLETYDGENVVKDYAEIFGLNLKNALKEAKKAGAQISNEEREKVKKLIAQKELQKRNKREKRNRIDSENDYIDFDDTFAFIAGYTDGGAAYGITHEEWAIFNASKEPLH
jgi:hypothetical protein